MKNGLVEYPDGSKHWYLNGQLHREDGPAAENVDGHKEWYLSDQLHREDGPAIEFPNGTKKWYLNGQHHREDGPAVERADGNKEWWKSGQYLMPATKVTLISSKTEDKPSPGDLVRDGNNLHLVTTVLGDPDQGYHLAFHE